MRVADGVRVIRANAGDAARALRRAREALGPRPSAEIARWLDQAARSVEQVEETSALLIAETES